MKDSKKTIQTPSEVDADLGPVLGADGQAVESGDIETTTRIIVIVEPRTGNQFKALIDLLNITQRDESAVGVQLRRLIAEAGFSLEEAQKMRELPTDDPRIAALGKLQAVDEALARAEANLAVKAFVKWNAPLPAPTLEDLTTKGGVYEAYAEAFNDQYVPTGRRSEEGAATN